MLSGYTNVVVFVPVVKMAALNYYLSVWEGTTIMATCLVCLLVVALARVSEGDEGERPRNTSHSVARPHLSCREHGRSLGVGGCRHRDTSAEHTNPSRTAPRARTVSRSARGREPRRASARRCNTRAAAARAGRFIRE